MSSRGSFPVSISENGPVSRQGPSSSESRTGSRRQLGTGGGADGSAPFGQGLPGRAERARRHDGQHPAGVDVPGVPVIGDVRLVAEGHGHQEPAAIGITRDERDSGWPRTGDGEVDGWNHGSLGRCKNGCGPLELGDRGLVRIADAGELLAQGAVDFVPSGRLGRGQDHPVQQRPERPPVAAVGDGRAEGGAGVVGEGAQPLRLVMAAAARAPGRAARPGAAGSRLGRAAGSCACWNSGSWGPPSTA